MNKHLQKILDLIEQNEKLTAEEKAVLIKAAKDTDSELTISEFKLERTEKVKRTTAILLEETIEELEQKRKAVEAQNRELEIESALERVRTVAMGMTKRDDMLDICRIISEQLELLQVRDIRNVQTAIMDEAKHIYLNYEYYPKHDKTFITEVDYTLHPVQLAFAQQMLKGKGSFFSTSLEGKELADFVQHQKAGPEFVDPFLSESVTLSWYWASLGPIAFGVSTYSPLNEESQEMVKRFRNVFDLSYRRYLDIERAAAQAKEAQIEAALEKVRSRSMGMQKSEELKEVIQLVYDQLVHLNINVEHAGFLIDYKERDDLHIWLADQRLVPSEVIIPCFDSPPNNSIKGAKEKGQNSFTYQLNFEEKNKFYKDLFEFIPGVPEETKGYYQNYPGLAGSGVLLENIGLYIENFTGTPYTDEENNTLMRFGKVFQQTYTRFLDLQNAEAQVREAQIQLALERARAQSMMMQHSTELDDTLRVFHEQVLLLNIPSAFSFLWLPDEDKDRHIFWAAWKENDSFKSKAINYPLDRTEPATAQCLIDWKGTEPVISYHVPPDGIKNYFAAWSELIGGVEQLKPEYFSYGLYYVEAFMKYGCFGVIVKADMTDGEKKILLRFAIEFERTYTRFLDLQKAEAQAREGQIQLALERVRARTMAMQKSEELPETSFILSQQMKELGEPTEQLSIGVVHEENGVIEISATLHGDMLKKIYQHSIEEPFMMSKVYNAWKNQQKTLVVELKGDELNAYNKYRNELTSSEMFPTNLGNDQRRIVYAAFFSKGMLALGANEPRPPQSLELLERFASVFDLTYTRFLDLQKAEAQAREAQIEAGLERVRSRTMAMHKSDELAATVKILFDEFKHLRIGQDLGNSTRGFITTVNEEKECFELWITETDGSEVNKNFVIPFKEQTTGAFIHEAWLNNKPYLISDLHGETLNQWLDYLTGTGFKVAPGIRGTRRVNNFIYYSKGFIGITTSIPLVENNIQLLQRFAKVFEQTYTRFLDLKNAELQAREAQIEAALEKVRSRTLAMQHSNELAETAAVLFQQLIWLGIQPNRLYIAIVKGDSANAEFWITDEDGTKVSSAFETNLRVNDTFKKMFDGWKAEMKSLVIDMHGDELQEYFKYLESIHVPFKGGLEQKRRLQNIAFFNNGFIGIASPDELPEETILLLERFAAVFNLTFTRFNDLQIAEAHALQAEQDLIAIKEAKQKAEEALTELQSTQKQLIQSEKMASLGELTAGIAHEIQNPLNFVNNFSEVSKELLDEMKEAMDKGDIEEAREIMNDIIQNLEKINHHGKRADGIVKGMLQHSRAGSGQKEPTDINALCDEYLRLAYHGLRAKDKSFNAKFETHFDDSIGKISILPQDMGRVVLNLINNAFYAVTERRIKAEAGYEPAIMVSTKKMGDMVEVRVKDNGTGIPQKVLDKIFQPFFTTKPTGQGTGLGLSLSYDIVTKGHDGELKVETKDGNGSEFIIKLHV